MSELKPFPFTIHSVEVAYPERSSKVRLGGGWSHTQKPAGPPARTFTLTFNAMKYYLNDEGLIDAEANIETNIHALDLFYQEHEQHKHFLYEHYAYGSLVVIFDVPFKTPKLLPGGDGATQSFTIQLVEIPV
ncbi:hypothetical protein [Pseudoalteromonas phage KB12-38]|nr:hypothetical protein [Pseudoalteromonas phage KB12-38]